MAESGGPGAPPRAHPEPGGRTVSEAQGGGRRAPQAGDGGGAVTQREAEAERSQGGGEGGEEDPATGWSAAGTRQGVSGAAGSEREAAALGSPHLTSGGRNSGRVSWGSSDDMPTAAEGSTPRTVTVAASTASTAGVTNETLEPAPQPELTNGSTEPVAELTGLQRSPWFRFRFMV